MQPLEALFRHNVWANLKLLEACSDLEDSVLDAEVPGTYGSIRSTLIHIVRAEASYYGRVTGEKPDRSGWGEVPSIEQLTVAARHTGIGLVREAPRVQPGDSVQVEWDGEMVDVDTSLILLQAINHATEHRTHVATILTQNGVAPPDMDGWSYVGALRADGDANV